jgi:hypothetical protein
MESDLGELATAGLASILADATILDLGRLSVRSVTGGELIWRKS